MKEYIVSVEDDDLDFDEIFIGHIRTQTELIRCKDCEERTDTKLFDGQRWNYCERLKCVVKDDDFCSFRGKK